MSDFVGTVEAGFEGDITLSMAGVVAFELLAPDEFVRGRLRSSAQECFDSETDETAAGSCEEEAHGDLLSRNWGAWGDTEPPNSSRSNLGLRVVPEGSNGSEFF